MDGSIKTIGVVGTGIMGLQLSEMLIEKEYCVIVKTRPGSNTAAFTDKIGAHLLKRYEPDKTADILSRLTVTESYTDLKKCDMIFESSKEDPEVKKEIFSELSKVCGDSTIIATNTSSISINKLAESIKNKTNFLGCHFFNPVFKMKLVEIIAGKETSKDTIARATEFCTGIDKITVNAIDSPGFIVNRLLLPQINEAVRILDFGISSVKEIDTAVTLGLNHPMGPLTLADYIGLDTCVSILNVLYEETGDPHYMPCKTLTDLCSKGYYGRKSKRGFYEY